MFCIDFKLYKWAHFYFEINFVIFKFKSIFIIDFYLTKIKFNFFSEQIHKHDKKWNITKISPNFFFFTPTSWQFSSPGKYLIEKNFQHQSRHRGTSQVDELRAVFTKEKSQFANQHIIFSPRITSVSPETTTRFHFTLGPQLPQNLPSTHLM